MVTNSAELDLTFQALADSKRRRILARLAEGEATVGELAEPFEVSRPAISKHLRVLERAGLVRRTPDGRMSRCELDARPMRDAAEWVQRYRRHWEGRLDALVRYLEEEAAAEDAPTAARATGEPATDELPAPAGDSPHHDDEEEDG